MRNSISYRIQNCTSYNVKVWVFPTKMKVSLNGDVIEQDFDFPEWDLSDYENVTLPIFAPLDYTSLGSRYEQEPIDIVIKGLRVMKAECSDCACDLNSNQQYFDPPGSRDSCPNLPETTTTVSSTTTSATTTTAASTTMASTTTTAGPTTTVATTSFASSTSTAASTTIAAPTTTAA